MEFKHKCGYGIADVAPECNCYDEWKKEEDLRSSDLISRKDLLAQIEKSKLYYENLGRFDYSAGLEKARYLIAKTKSI
jgi:hypothetical protein